MITYQYKFVIANLKSPISMEQKVNELAREGWLVQSVVTGTHPTNNFITVMYREFKE